MASSKEPVRWDEMPDEILLNILSFLLPHHIAGLQLVSRKLRKFCLDEELWKRHCFESSSWYQSLQNRRSLLNGPSSFKPADDVASTAVLLNPESSGTDEALEDPEPEPAKQNRWRELQDLANWDPAFPGEKVSWYDEYIQREGPASVNWLQTPRIRDRDCEAIIEARGVDLYYPYDGNDGIGTMLAVSPLDDGSVCLWDVNGTRRKAGAVLARSKTDILFIDGPGSQNLRRSKRVDTGVTECVRVDNYRNRAYFAVQSHLIEIDLERLDVVSRESFEWSITTLSTISEGVPLTVGTSLGIHLHDFRARARVSHDVVEQLDGPSSEDNNVFRSIFDPRPLPPYAPLSQPTPLSILHLPEPGTGDLVSHDIYVSGRFSSILHYDRRKFPNIAGSIHSGASSVNSLVALPYPFSPLDNEVRRTGELTAEQVKKAKSGGRGRTLIAGGLYNTKGSLEIYGLSPSTDPVLGEVMQQDSVFKNRQTVASSAIMSVASHGTKIVFSDGSGLIKWFERDGTTECRALKIGHCEGDDAPSLFASMSAAGEMARKLVSTRSKRGHERLNNDNILFWTGERLGLVSFTSKSQYHSKDFEDTGNPETMAEEEEGQQYAGQIRDALHRQADEVRFMTNFGKGTWAA
ncbi:hypothetical protein PT974_06156 [Cladobotryum mycophilum]|uniref:F-box domain-containing protein n=1 Tax=Cladobotryum mycophilum TaxID=491253 RepID=A0ABR0SKS1_9HYPO